MTTDSYERINCPIAHTLAVLGDQWTLLIVRDALWGLRRFGEFQQSLGISRNLLTRRLKELCEHGILERVALPGSKRFAYRPTGKCHDLRLVILAMAEWGERWRPDPKGARIQILERESGRPVGVRFCALADHTEIDTAQVEVIRRGFNPPDDSLLGH